MNPLSKRKTQSDATKIELVSGPWCGERVPYRPSVQLYLMPHHGRVHQYLLEEDRKTALHQTLEPPTK